MRLIDADIIAQQMRELPHEYKNKEQRARTGGIACCQEIVREAPSIDICFCRECIYYDPPHVDDNGKRIEYKDLPEEAFDTLGTGLVNISYGVNIGGRCCVDYNCGYAEDKRVYRAEDDFCSKGRRPLNSSEKPNNSERSSE